MIAATNDYLEESISRGSFREDIYHRLNKFDFVAPSLNGRKEDVMLFAHYFLNSSNKRLNKKVVSFSEEVINIFTHYTWPGNLREFKSVINRATLLTSGNTITVDQLSPNLLNQENDGFALLNP